MAHPSWSPHRVPSPPPQRRLWCGLPPSCGCCCLVAMTTHRGFIFNSRRRLEGRRRRSPAALQSGGGMHPGLALAFRPGAGLTPMEGAPLTALLAANSSWAPPECPGEGAQMRPWSWKDPAPKYEAASLLRSYTHCPTQSGDPEGVSSGPSAGEESEAQPDEIQSSREAEGVAQTGSSPSPGGACLSASPNRPVASLSEATEGSPWTDKDWPSPASKCFQVFPGSVSVLLHSGHPQHLESRLGGRWLCGAATKGRQGHWEAAGV